MYYNNLPALHERPKDRHTESNISLEVKWNDGTRVDDDDLVLV